MSVVTDPVSYNGNLLRELNLNVFHQKRKQSQEKRRERYKARWRMCSLAGGVLAQCIHTSSQHTLYMSCNSVCQLHLSEAGENIIIPFFFFFSEKKTSPRFQWLLRSVSCSYTTSEPAWRKLEGQVDHPAPFTFLQILWIAPPFLSIPAKPAQFFISRVVAWYITYCPHGA